MRKFAYICVHRIPLTMHPVSEASMHPVHRHRRQQACQTSPNGLESHSDMGEVTEEEGNHNCMLGRSQVAICNLD
jgi:hypothetical protein